MLPRHPFVIGTSVRNQSHYLLELEDILRMKLFLVDPMIADSFSSLDAIRCGYRVIAGGVSYQIVGFVCTLRWGSDIEFNKKIFGRSEPSYTHSTSFSLFLFLSLSLFLSLLHTFPLSTTIIMSVESEYNTEAVAATLIPSDQIDGTFRSSCVGEYERHTSLSPYSS